MKQTKPRQVNLYEAKTQLSQLVKEAAAGAEIIIAKAGEPMARLVPLAPDSAPAHVLFPQMRAIADRYVADKVNVVEPNDLRDIGCSPYHGQILERLIVAIKPDEAAGESSELPRYDSLRPEGSTADIDFWTSKDVRQTIQSHVNYVVADTVKWEQQAAYYIDKHHGVTLSSKTRGSVSASHICTMDSRTTISRISSSHQV